MKIKLKTKSPTPAYPIGEFHHNGKITLVAEGLSQADYRDIKRALQWAFKEKMK